MAIDAIDYANQALGRICQQYKDKPKYTALVQELAKSAQTYIDEPISEFLTIYDIDSAEGHNLDVIGEIVGQDREVIDYGQLEFFGFDGALNAGSFGDENDTNVGARFRSQDEDTTAGKTLSDSEYRIFIRARILRNYSASTPEEVIQALLLILNVDSVEIVEGVMTITIQSVTGTVDPNDLYLVQTYDIIPRPTGVTLISAI